MGLEQFEGTPTQQEIDALQAHMANQPDAEVTPPATPAEGAESIDTPTVPETVELKPWEIPSEPEPDETEYTSKLLSEYEISELKAANVYKTLKKITDKAPAQADDILQDGIVSKIADLRRAGKSEQEIVKMLTPKSFEGRDEFDIYKENALSEFNDLTEEEIQESWDAKDVIQRKREIKAIKDKYQSQSEAIINEAVNANVTRKQSETAYNQAVIASAREVLTQSVGQQIAGYTIKPEDIAAVENQLRGTPEEIRKDPAKYAKMQIGQAIKLALFDKILAEKTSEARFEGKKEEFDKDHNVSRKGKFQGAPLESATQEQKNLKAVKYLLNQ